MRINFSHATYEEADLRVKNLRKSKGITNKDYNLRAIMLDTQGPEIRTGSWDGGARRIELEMGKKILLSTDTANRSIQTKDKLFITYQDLKNSVTRDSVILLDDGAIELRVEEVKNNGEIACRIMNNGTLGNKKGVNIPGAKITLPALSEKDKEDLRWGVKNDVDYIAASFIRKVEDIREVKNYLRLLMNELQPTGYPAPQIISKIESTEALQNFDSILRESDGIMVARGDLGVEIPMETLTNVQKEIVRRCNLAGKPVIVATQMLESMQNNPRPTRAECTDVANAVYDGADCVMLSGESAQGLYPIQSVATMKRIVDQAEHWLEKNPSLSQAAVNKPKGKDNTIDAMAYAAVEASKNLNATCIVVLSKSGQTAINLSKYRPHVPIVCLVPTQKAARLLQMHRCIHPVVSSCTNTDTAIKEATMLGFCVKGDNAVVVAGEKETDVAGTAITIRVAKVL